jgi:hypothetical protein
MAPVLKLLWPNDIFPGGFGKKDIERAASNVVVAAVAFVCVMLLDAEWPAICTDSVK